MDYFISNLPVIFGAACIVALAAVLYWYSLYRSAKAKRQRAEARIKAAQMKKDAESTESKE